MTPRELVAMQFPGKVLLSLIEAGAAIGLAKQTCYNMHSRGTFPLPVKSVGAKPMVSIVNLVKYLEGFDFSTKTSSPEIPAAPVSRASEPQTPRRRGRPTKEEQLRRQGLI